MKPVWPLLAAFGAALSVAGACRPPAAPAPEARQAETIQPVATTLPAATTVPAPTANRTSPEPAPAAAWTEHRTEALRVRLPASWQAGAPDATGAAARLSAFRQENADLAGFLGDAGALARVAFSAKDESNAAQGFADNLNIRRMALDDRRAEDLPEMAETIASQYRQLGFDVLETVAGPEIGGLPAARIAYTFAAADRGAAPVELSGLQLLAAAPADLWILTYTTTSDRFATLRPIFEESAQSFRIR